MRPNACMCECTFIHTFLIIYYAFQCFCVTSPNWRHSGITRGCCHKFSILFLAKLALFARHKVCKHTGMLCQFHNSTPAGHSGHGHVYIHRNLHTYLSKKNIYVYVCAFLIYAPQLIVKYCTSVAFGVANFACAADDDDEFLYKYKK